MKLFFGLGNPGKTYQNNRHNLGQMVIHKITNLTNKPKLSSQLAELNGNIFAISNDYMNNSGFSIAKVASFYKISPENIYLIHDDLDLSVGEYRFQFDRGPAGHNGIKSTIEQLGTQAFNRIRIGIDHPRHSTTPQMAVEDYVLLPFTTAEKVIIEETIDKIIPEIEKLGH
jgi:PTH1 family peptidyl-tRNA hydrolase